MYTSQNKITSLEHGTGGNCKDGTTCPQPVADTHLFAVLEGCLVERDHLDLPVVRASGGKSSLGNIGQR